MVPILHTAVCRVFGYFWGSVSEPGGPKTEGIDEAWSPEGSLRSPDPEKSTLTDPSVIFFDLEGGFSVSLAMRHDMSSSSEESYKLVDWSSKALFFAVAS